MKKGKCLDEWWQQRLRHYAKRRHASKKFSSGNKFTFAKPLKLTMTVHHFSSYIWLTPQPFRESKPKASTVTLEEQIDGNLLLAAVLCADSLIPSKLICLDLLNLMNHFRSRSSFPETRNVNLVSVYIMNLQKLKMIMWNHAGGVIFKQSNKMTL